MGQDTMRLAGEPTRIPVAGELSPWVDEFRRVLTEGGFTRHTVTTHTHLIADLSDWLTRRGLTAERFTVDEVAVFFSRPTDCRPDRIGIHTRRGADDGIPPRARLDSRGVPSHAERTDRIPDRGILSLPGIGPGFGPVVDPAISDNGTTVLDRLAGTADGDVAGPFSGPGHRVRPGRGIPPAGLVGQVSGHRVAVAASIPDVAGHAPAGLATAVPAVAGWGLQSLPRGINANLLTAMLSGCDRNAPLGRRDYAILLMLSRMGLRNGEVCRLGLDDINWSAGEVLIHGKGNRLEHVPLPVDVGRALVEYLTDGRPVLGDSRRVFLIGRAPFTGLTLGTMVSVVAAAARRAGAAGPVSPHRLRHTVASDLLAKGAPLIEIGQLLRHQVESTTAIYAKLDYHALRELVRPWPGA